MDKIENTIAVYERLRKQKYRITIENGTSFVLEFKPEHYHHLAGYHYLTDRIDICDPPFGKRKFYRSVKNKLIDSVSITTSELFASVSDRIDYFGYLEEILTEAECKIIVEFDPIKADSDIVAKYFLFKRVGNSLLKEPVTYFNLFIGYDDDAKYYFPATYTVERSKKYVNEQKMLDCRIELI